MSKVWYCPNCGYEVGTRGRCHLCRQRLVASALPELPVGEEEDEVAYRLETWADRDRGRLIENLNAMELLHRFEDDELVVAAEDEGRVDDLIADLAANPEPDAASGNSATGEAVWEPSGGEEDERISAGLDLLADAARRLRADPTDMQADADVAEASATVFMVDGYPGVDPDSWAAIGRVTRRLLSALGADEALENEIRAEAAVLDKLLDSLVDSGHEDDEAPEPETDGEETVYELPEWLPEQRARLGILLDEAGIHHLWDGDDLVVPSDHESEVESLFDAVVAVGGDDDDDDGEARYRSLEELFAAADRLAGDPADEQRAADTVARVQEAAGPPPIGLDEVQWFRIMSQARTLSDCIEGGYDEHVIAEQARSLRDLLRAVV